MERRIWVGCLACYSAGGLTGKWIELEDMDESEVTPEFIHDHRTAHEELWVMDSEGFEGLISGERNVADFYAWHDILTDLPKWIEEEAVIAYVDNQSLTAHGFSLSDFEDAYVGEYDSDEEFAEEYCEDFVPSGLPDFLRYRIDWQGVARDMLLSDYSMVESRDGRRFYFRY